jgi:acyl dehydratase
MSAIEDALKQLQARIGETSPPGDWFVVTQEHVNKFAEVSGDHQWIHVDVERAKRESPYRGPIAHGMLTLSIMGLVGRRAAGGGEGAAAARMPGQIAGINYGFDRVRFPSPVPVGARIRSHRTLRRAEIKGNTIEVMNEVVVEVEGGDKPVCVAESLSRMVFAPGR